MTGQSNSAAERSAHVERGPARAVPGESFLVEVSPGIFKLKAVAQAESERDAANITCEAAIKAVGRLNAKIAELQAALALGLKMQEAQKAYFKGRTREALAASLEIEREFARVARTLVEDAP